jgi:hypothetical protein
MLNFRSVPLWSVLTVGVAATLTAAALATKPAVSPAPSSPPATTDKQPAVEKPQAEKPAAQKPAGLPEAWIGHFRGPAQVLQPGRPPMEFTMELIVAPSATAGEYTWTIVYDGAQGKQTRPYKLITRDAAKGHFAVDEANGIVLDCRLFGNTFYGQFEIAGTRITTRESLEKAGTPDEQLVVEMVTTMVDSAATSGGKDGIPEVRSWFPASLQRAVLKRVPAGGKPAATVPETPKLAAPDGR